MIYLKCQGNRRCTEINYFRDLLKNVDKILILMPFIFAAISILMIGSISYSDSFEITRDIVVQGVAYLLGAVIIFLLLFIDYGQYAGIWILLYAVSIIMMLLVYTPLGYNYSTGSQAWIKLGFTTLQPCEFVKITFTLSYAKYLSERRDALHTFKGLCKAVLFAAPVIALVLIEDLGNALVFIFMMVIMLYAAGVDFKLYAKCAGVVVAMLPVAYFCMHGYQKERIDAFLHPNDKTLAGNYQVWQSKIAIGSGGFTGKGLFQGTQKSLEYLPVAKSDFIFAVICEELGFIGGAIVIMIYAVFMYRIMRIANNCKDRFSMLIVSGLGAMFFFQIFENIGMTMGIMPVTGITLPFISCGGTSVIANMIALGVILSIGIRSKVINF